jgi:hypothetical protein
MPLSKAQSRALLLEWKAEIEALDTKIDAERVLIQTAKANAERLQKQRDPLVEEFQMMVQRHKRLFNEAV